MKAYYHKNQLIKVWADSTNTDKLGKKTKNYAATVNGKTVGEFFKTSTQAVNEAIKQIDEII